MATTLLWCSGISYALPHFHTPFPLSSQCRAEKSLLHWNNTHSRARAKPTWHCQEPAPLTSLSLAWRHFCDVNRMLRRTLTWKRMHACRDAVKRDGEHGLVIEEKFLSWPVSVAWGLCFEWKGIVIVPYWTQCLFCIYLLIRLRRCDALTTHNKKGHRNKSGFLRAWPTWLVEMATLKNKPRRTATSGKSW